MPKIEIIPSSYIYNYLVYSGLKESYVMYNIYRNYFFCNFWRYDCNVCSQILSPMTVYWSHTSKRVRLYDSELVEFARMICYSSIRSDGWMTAKTTPFWKHTSTRRLNAWPRRVCYNLIATHYCNIIFLSHDDKILCCVCLSSY